MTPQGFPLSWEHLYLSDLSDEMVEDIKRLVAERSLQILEEEEETAE